MKPKLLQSNHILIAEPCPRCGKEEKLILKSSDYENAKISGVAGKAISHGDHTLVVFFGTKGTHRGQYIYENDMKLYQRKNNIRNNIDNLFIHGILVVDPVKGEFDDSHCPIFTEQQSSFMVTTIMSSLADLRVPDGKLATLTFAGIELFIIKSKEKTIIVFPQEGKENFVKQITPSLLNHKITSDAIEELFRSSLIEDVMHSKNRFVRLSTTYPRYLGHNLQQDRLNNQTQLIARELHIPQQIIDQINSILMKYADGSRNLRILFDEWVSIQATDDWNIFLSILSHLEKNGFIAVNEKRGYLKMKERHGLELRFGGSRYG